MSKFLVKSVALAFVLSIVTILTLTPTPVDAVPAAASPVLDHASIY